MTEAPEPWIVRVTVHVESAEVADWLARALGAEVGREVPRSRAQVRRAAEKTVEVGIEAHDSGALRAALNTYLGWVHLALATARAARSRPRSSA